MSNCHFFVKHHPSKEINSLSPLIIVEGDFSIDNPSVVFVNSNDQVFSKLVLELVCLQKDKSDSNFKTKSLIQLSGRITHKKPFLIASQ